MPFFAILENPPKPELLRKILAKLRDDKLRYKVGDDMNDPVRLQVFFTFVNAPFKIDVSRGL